MTINPQVDALLTQMRQFPAPDFNTATPAEVRAASDNPLAFGLAPEVALVRDLTVPLPGRSLAARLYVPERGAGPAPLTIYFHGGGWVVGTLDTHDRTCRALTLASGSAILSIAYRLAPEHPYPEPLEDCYGALEWAAANSKALGVDAARLAVAGDSAGGNLAAATAILARDRGGPALCHQLLIYPVTDVDFSRPSYRENGEAGGFLTTAMMRWFWSHYLAGRTTDETPLAVIAQVEDLAGLPPATVLTAQYDPLRDEGEAYASRLKGAGVACQHWTAPGMIHGFVSLFEAVPDAMPWIQRMGARLRQALG
ncbi:alpha/beta hydrolase [Parafrankia sp. BMG5.11]|uniref:alpha/beta hydrolase n=1 Tax=Parafrankia sp. BMG5.11 TaxID=222540 RepID=UPI001040CD7B|nr:alpha/beta hydrolase [Parafrankia sp. BMG5.11]TCJ36999.1 alpha/beta hydrolase [Parafrankia sp. BMG5.11]